MRPDDSSPFGLLLSREESRLLTTTRRLFAFEAFVEELERVTRGKQFEIRNDILWLAMIDSRDLHVIHLASWAKAFYSPGGFLGQVQAHHLRDLSKHRRRDPGRSEEPPFDGIHNKNHEEAFLRLFLGSLDDFPTPQDLEALTTHFVEKMTPVITDRHVFRAHPYEKRETGTAKSLDHPELRNLTTWAEHLLNDFSIVGHNSELGYREMNETLGRHAAPEIVDSILFWSSEEFQRLRGDLDREAFYNRLHARHDAIDGDDKPTFNDLPEDE